MTSLPELNPADLRRVIQLMISSHSVKDRLCLKVVGAAVRAAGNFFVLTTAVFLIFASRSFMRTIHVPQRFEVQTRSALEDIDCDLELCFGFTPEALGCQLFEEPPRWLGQLEPDVPIVGCVIENQLGNWLEEGKYLYLTGCRGPRFHGYIAFVDGEPVVIRTPMEMRSFYAPIRSEAEALSYAIAYTNMNVRTKFSDPGGFTWFHVLSVETTHVESLRGGFLVNLFRETYCGCGPIQLIEEDFFVARDGSLTTVGQERIYSSWIGFGCTD